MFLRAVLYYPYNMQIIRREAMSTDAKRAGNARYLATQKTITVRTRPENAERLQIAAAAAGESVNSYILQACKERMERDASK